MRASLRTGLASLLVLSLAACGDDDSSSDERDASADVGSDVSADAGTDTDVADAATDTAADAVPEAGPDAEEQCFTPEPSCVGECRIDFFNTDPGRPNVFQIDIQNLNQGTMNVVDVLISDAPPEMTLSDGWFTYMERAGNGTWTPAGSGQGFDVIGDPIPIGEGDVFTVDVRLADRTAGVDCPSGSSRDCGTLLIEVPNCDGTPIFTAVSLQF